MGNQSPGVNCLLMERPPGQPHKCPLPTSLPTPMSPHLTLALGAYLYFPPWGGLGTAPFFRVGLPCTKWLSPSSPRFTFLPLPKTFLLWGSPQSCPPSQLFPAVRGYIYLLCSCSSSVTIFCYRIFWLLVEALIRNAAINGCAPLPLGCSFFNPHCLLQCHPFPFFFIEFQVYCTC